MGKVTFQLEGAGEVAIDSAAGENLLSLARKANVAVDAPCSGNGSCGKCRVKLLGGMLVSEKTRHIDSASYDAGWRLACASTVDGDATVLVPDIASAYRSRMQVADLSSPQEVAIFNSIQASLEQAGLTRQSAVRELELTLEAPTLADTMPDNERLTRALRAAVGVEQVHLPYFLLQKLPRLLRESRFELRCVYQTRSDAIEVLDLLPASDPLPLCGLAIDIGTTTVSGVLVELATGRILSKASTGNGQIRFGADVINRIVEQQKPGGVERLQKAIVEETLVPLIESLCRCSGIPRERVYRMVVASNSTMNHLLLGVDAEPLRTEPYVPAFFELAPLACSEIGIKLSPGARLHLAPNIGSYVGGDISAGTLAGMMWRSHDLSLLIDLGTNGEIVFGNDEFLVACACSAGPAFEGGEISCGMRATDGAIEACTIDEHTMEPSLSVIGGQRPVGLCGSGIIDLIAELFRTGIVNGKGKFVREGSRVETDEFGVGSYVLAFPEEAASGRTIALSEIDIDNFIRAKGAIFSATLTMIAALGFAPSDIRHVSVAGGIGSGINIANAIRIGMFCDLPLERYRYIGNSSLAGAYAVLVSEKAAAHLHTLARSMTYLELSVQPGYMDAFIAACFLPHTDDRLFPSVAAR
jgi:uncharacterized 2Fe-2S/4Fe-4S cluster protein (DUF4445 family)